MIIEDPKPLNQSLHFKWNKNLLFLVELLNEHKRTFKKKNVSVHSRAPEVPPAIFQVTGKSPPMVTTASPVKQRPPLFTGRPLPQNEGFPPEVFMGFSVICCWFSLVDVDGFLTGFSWCFSVWQWLPWCVLYRFKKLFICFHMILEGWNDLIAFLHVSNTFFPSKFSRFPKELERFHGFGRNGQPP